MNRLVVMSIRPRFAKAIYSRTKQFEFRRVRTQLRSGDLVLVYESAPVSYLTGQFHVGKVVIGSPTDLIELEAEGTSRVAVQHYLLGAQVASAIEVLDPVRWREKVCFNEFLPGYRPPQSYAFVMERVNGVFCCPS